MESPNCGLLLVYYGDDDLVTHRSLTSNGLGEEYHSGPQSAEILDMLSESNQVIVARNDPTGNCPYHVTMTLDYGDKPVYEILDALESDQTEAALLYESLIAIPMDKLNDHGSLIIHTIFNNQVTN